MPFPTRNTQTLHETLQAAKEEAFRVKIYAKELHAHMIKEDVSVNQFMDFMQGLGVAMNTWQVCVNTVGMADYARSQLGEDFNIVAETQELMTSADGVLTWIKGNLPQDKEGNLITRKLVGNSVNTTTFSPEKSANFAPILSRLINAID